jgi:hypothetical protein
MAADNEWKERHNDYGMVVWLSPLLRHRVIVCNDSIQYIYQIKDGKDDWRGKSFHVEWSSLHRRYPDLELMGCPLQSPNMLSSERRRLMHASVELMRGPAESNDALDQGIGSAMELISLSGGLYQL